jgi:hypothetical protein
LGSLSTDALVTEAIFTQCCFNCAAIMHSDCQIEVSDLYAAKSDCGVCALLLRAAEPHWRRSNGSCYITRDESALTIGDDGRRFLRLGTTTPGYKSGNLLTVYMLCRVLRCA